ncbi:MAG: sigma 54-interacting transcriptional regulator [Spirochaetota bacterium]|jgi:DNA-binding NtrC family response regulator|nr:sigma 54-interacting transcriptional regulator [Spirochaetota bacterium]
MTLFILSADWRFKERFKQHFSPACLRGFTTIARTVAAIEQQSPDLLIVDSRLKEGSHTLLLQQLERLAICSTILLCVEEEGETLPTPETSLCLYVVPRSEMRAQKVFEYLDPCAREASTYEVCGLLGESEMMVRLRKQLYEWGRADCSIHLYGETGTGKELAAQYLHRLKYPYRTMVSINCSLLCDALGKSMFFGHTKGAFTDGTIELSGLIKEADGTTLFLDEIENLAPHFQAYLLRLLETGEYRRLGDTAIHTSQFRLISASNERLDQMVGSVIRKDFLYRVCDVVITLPPLREHISDIPTLIKSHLSSLGVHKGVDASSLDLLMTYDWPGNVRELFSVIRRASLISGDGPDIHIDEADLLVAPHNPWTP